MRQTFFTFAAFFFVLFPCLFGKIMFGGVVER